jgi:hypothetical protein
MNVTVSASTTALGAKDPRDANPDEVKEDHRARQHQHVAEIRCRREHRRDHGQQHGVFEMPSEPAGRRIS